MPLKFGPKGYGLGTYAGGGDDDGSSSSPPNNNHDAAVGSNRPPPKGEELRNPNHGSATDHHTKWLEQFIDKEGSDDSGEKKQDAKGGGGIKFGTGVDLGSGKGKNTEAGVGPGAGVLGKNKIDEEVIKKAIEEDQLAINQKLVSQTFEGAEDTVDHGAGIGFGTGVDLGSGAPGSAPGPGTGAVGAVDATGGQGDIPMKGLIGADAGTTITLPKAADIFVKSTTKTQKSSLVSNKLLNPKMDWGKFADEKEEPKAPPYFVHTIPEENGMRSDVPEILAALDFVMTKAWSVEGANEFGAIQDIEDYFDLRFYQSNLRLSDATFCLEKLHAFSQANDVGMAAMNPNGFDPNLNIVDNRRASFSVEISRINQARHQLIRLYKKVEKWLATLDIRDVCTHSTVYKDHYAAIWDDMLKVGSPSGVLTYYDPAYSNAGISSSEDILTIFSNLGLSALHLDNALGPKIFYQLMVDLKRIATAGMFDTLVYRTNTSNLTPDIPTIKTKGVIRASFGYLKQEAESKFRMTKSVYTGAGLGAQNALDIMLPGIAEPGGSSRLAACMNAISREASISAGWAGLMGLDLPFNDAPVLHHPTATEAAPGYDENDLWNGILGYPTATPHAVSSIRNFVSPTGLGLFKNNFSQETPTTPSDQKYTPPIAWAVINEELTDDLKTPITSFDWCMPFLQRDLMPMGFPVASSGESFFVNAMFKPADPRPFLEWRWLFNWSQGLKVSMEQASNLTRFLLDMKDPGESSGVFASQLPQNTNWTNKLASANMFLGPFADRLANSLGSIIHGTQTIAEINSAQFSEVAENQLDELAGIFTVINLESHKGLTTQKVVLAWLFRQAHELEKMGDTKLKNDLYKVLLRRRDRIVFQSGGGEVVGMTLQHWQLQFNCDSKKDFFWRTDKGGQLEVSPNYFENQQAMEGLAGANTDIEMLAEDIITHCRLPSAGYETFPKLPSQKITANYLKWAFNENFFGEWNAHSYDLYVGGPTSSLLDDQYLLTPDAIKEAIEWVINDAPIFGNGVAGNPGAGGPSGNLLDEIVFFVWDVQKSAQEACTTNRLTGFDAGFSGDVALWYSTDNAGVSETLDGLPTKGARLSRASGWSEDVFLAFAFEMFFDIIGKHAGIGTETIFYNSSPPESATSYPVVTVNREHNRQLAAWVRWMMRPNAEPFFTHGLIPTSKKWFDNFWKTDGEGYELTDNMFYTIGGDLFTNGTALGWDVDISNARTQLVEEDFNVNAILASLQAYTRTVLDAAEELKGYMQATPAPLGSPTSQASMSIPEPGFFHDGSLTLANVSTSLLAFDPFYKMLFKGLNPSQCIQSAKLISDEIEKLVHGPKTSPANVGASFPLGSYSTTEWAPGAAGAEPAMSMAGPAGKMPMIIQSLLKSPEFSYPAAGNIKILSVGLPCGMIDMLRRAPITKDVKELVQWGSSAGAVSAEPVPRYGSYATSTVIRVVVHRNDMANQGIKFFPREFLFDASIFVDDLLTRHYSLLEAGSLTDPESDTLRNIELSRTEWGTSGAGSITLTRKLVKDLFDDSKAFDPRSAGIYALLWGTFNSNPEYQSMIINHVLDKALQVYYKVGFGMNFNEGVFRPDTPKNPLGWINKILVDEKALDWLKSVQSTSSTGGLKDGVTVGPYVNTIVSPAGLPPILGEKYGRHYSPWDSVKAGSFLNSRLVSEQGLQCFRTVCSSHIFSPRLSALKSLMPSLFDRVFMVPVDIDSFCIDESSSDPQAFAHLLGKGIIKASLGDPPLWILNRVGGDAGASFAEVGDLFGFDQFSVEIILEDLEED